MIALTADGRQTTVVHAYRFNALERKWVWVTLIYFGRFLSLRAFLRVAPVGRAGGFGKETYLFAFWTNSLCGDGLIPLSRPIHYLSTFQRFVVYTLAEETFAFSFFFSFYFCVVVPLKAVINTLPTLFLSLALFSLYPPPPSPTYPRPYL